MSSQRSYDPITRRRGTRGFAAIVTGLAGLVAVGATLAPAGAASVDPVVRSWLLIAAIAMGVGHASAVVGLIRARRWSARLVGYLAAVGIGVSAYVALVTATGLDPFGTTSALPVDQARAEGLGLAIWMIGLWLVAVRYTMRGFPTSASATGRRPMAGVALAS